MPDVPTLAESGLAGYDMTTWIGVCAPARTPAPIVAAPEAALSRVLESPDVRRQLLDAGIEPTCLPAERLSRLIDSEVNRFATIVRAAGIEPEP